MSSYLIGKQIDQYRIVEVLGYGGMGTVFKAIDTHLEKPVALKMMDLRLTGNKEFLKRFRTEGKSQASLQHENIVTVHTMREAETGLYIAMEYVPGRVLSHLIRELGPLQPPRAVEIFRQILSAIGHAHTNGVIHRDIKPGNIILRDDGVVKVTDFGMARVEQDPKLTGTVVSGGTLVYSSPEQIKSLKYTDQRSDVYSLGMTLYDMLAGTLPFQDTDSNLDIQLAIIEGRVPPPNELNPMIPDALVRMIQRAISLKPENRYQNVAEWVHELAELDAAPSDGFAPAASTPTRTAVQLTDEEATEVGGVPLSSAQEGTELMTAAQPDSTRNAAAIPVSSSGKYRLPILAGVLMLFVTLFLYIQPIAFRQSEILPAGSTNPASMGGLIVRSDPPGAHIILDGVILEEVRTPWQVEGIETGAYHIIVRKTGFVDDTITTIVERDSVPAVIFARLAPERRESALPRGYDSPTGEREGVAAEAAILVSKANLLAANSEDEQAFKLYTEAIALREDDAMAFAGRGYVLDNLGRYAEAREDYSQALKLRPGDVTTLVNRGITLNNLGLFAEAVVDFDRAIALSPGTKEAFVHRGLANEQLGNIEEAIEDYSRSIEIDEEYALAYNNRAVLLARSGERDRAEQDLKSVLRLDPDHSLAAYNLGCLSATSGDTSVALNYLESALANGFSDFEAIVKDGDWDAVRGSARFRSLIKRYGR